MSPAKATPALKHPATIYVVYYKRLLTDLWAARAGIDGQYSSAKNAEKKLNLGLGVEQQLRLAELGVLYYGVELSFATTRFNNRKNRVDRYGASPLVGATVMLHRNFSVSTEVKLDVLYTLFREPGAFDKAANSEEWDVSLGGVGSFLLGVHF